MANKSGPHDILFESVKEDRGWYFVEYSPPIPNYRFSILTLSIVEGQLASVVAAAMELEANVWLSRYPVPLMTTAFADDGDVVSLEDIRPSPYLMAWVDPLSEKPILRWELVANEELPDIGLKRDVMENVFADIPFKTRRYIHEEVAQQAAVRKAGWWVVIAWLALVPLAVAVLEWWSDLLGLAVLAYAFVKAGIVALRLTGNLPKSQRERDKEAEELRMRHHHYHCERNPEAFRNLKAENFRQAEIERTRAEAAQLKACNRDS